MRRLLKGVCICGGVSATASWVYEWNEVETSPPSPYYTARCMEEPTDATQVISSSSRLDTTHDHVTDVLIVGAGFAGLHTALLLSSRHIATTVVEVRTVGAGASGVNGGMAIPGFHTEQETLASWFNPKLSQDLYAQTLAGSDWIRALVRKYHVECDLVEEGYATLHRRRPSVGNSTPSSELLEDKSGRCLVHSPTLDPTSGDVISEAFSVNPLALCQGLARAVRSEGGRIVEHTAAESISFDETQEVYPWKVVLRNRDSGGAVVCRARHVVCATNAVPSWFSLWHSLLHVPIYSAILVTPPVDRDVLDRLLPSRMNLCDDRRVLAYFRRLKDDRILWGGRMPSAVRLPNSMVASMLHADLAATFPELSSNGVDLSKCDVWTGRMITGYRPLPLVGRVDPTWDYFRKRRQRSRADDGLAPSTTTVGYSVSKHPPQLWLNTGHFCHGVVPTAAAAIAIDAAIATGATDLIEQWEVIQPSFPIPAPFKQAVAQICSWTLLLADYLE